MTQSQLLAKEVYLIDRVDNRKREKMRHMKCICFLRPTGKSVQALVEELRDPCYSDYYLYFTNSLRKSDIERLAEADENEVVRELQEYFADYLAINQDLYSLNVSFPDWHLFVENSSTWDTNALSRVAEGILSVLLSLKKKPLIRFEKSSALAKKLAAEISEVVLNPEQDSFYGKSMFLNLGDLGATIKTYVDEYQVKHKSSQQIDSIADMKKFVEEYPEFRKLSGNVTKHVTLVGELSRLVSKYSLMEVGELEQSLAVTENHAADLKTLRGLIERPNVTDDTKVRLVLLYALRYEKSPNNATAQLIELLARNKVNEKRIALVKQMIQYAGADQRAEDIFSNKDVFARTRNAFRGLKGVENVYTQHTPHIVETIQELIKGRLKEQSHPFFEGSTRDKPQDIIIFMIGGATYGEAREISKLTVSNPGVKIIFGGTTIHNAQSFMAETADAVSRWHGKSDPTSPKPERLRSVRTDA
ncbi:vacuolar protein sorting-associated protein 45 [Rhizophlyctis rosea]|uniref:Vacuolar protein sorting-associated protein 45 n=1 Tax=Rhizophlyctis rosea TaxID=64517 RepID=A0AAD5SIJ6_9FUNG|nr:vacuolar protein sorting-associated protein 45 [Rhizophlyctis rosea]